MKSLEKLYKVVSETTYILYLYAIGLVLPLYLHNAYFDAMESKAACFKYIVYICIPFLLGTIILKVLTKKINLKSTFDISLIVFLLACTISSLLSKYTKYAITGELGWHVGLFSIASIVIFIIILKDLTLKYKYLLIPIYIVYSLITLITITDGMGLDLLSFREFITKYQYYSYFSTIGNSNWYVGYLCLFLPYFVCLYIKEEGKEKRILYYLISIESLASMMIIRANGIFLGIGFCAFFMIPYIMDNLNYIKRFSLLLIGFAIILLLMKIIPSFNSLIISFDLIRTIMMSYLFIVSFIVFSVILFFLANKTDNNKYQMNKNKIIIAIEIMLLTAVIVLPLLAIKGNYMDLDNGRLEIWKESFDAYLNRFSVKEKLFGFGPELTSGVYIELTNKYNANYNSSHSEFVQLLLTMGIFGLISWLMCWFCLFRAFFKEKAYKKVQLIPVFMGVFAYFGQSFVNSATILNLGTLSLFIIWLFQEMKTFSK